jgi:hypothetical protein
MELVIKVIQSITFVLIKVLLSNTFGVSIFSLFTLINLNFILNRGCFKITYSINLFIAVTQFQNF